MRRSVIVGAGRRANGMTRSIKQAGGFDPVAVVEPVDDRRSAFAAEHDISHSFGSLEAFFASGIEVDTAWVFTPHYAHENPFVACAEQGLDIFCEKPIEMDLAAADRMVQAARFNGIKSMFGFNRRYMPVGRLARAITKNEPPVYIHVSKSRPMNYGRMLAENAVHSVELLLRLAGSIPEKVQAVGRFQDADMESEEYIAAAVQFVSGNAGSVQMITKGSGVVERLEVYGSDYTLTGSFSRHISYSGDGDRLREAAGVAGLGLVEQGEGNYTLEAEDTDDKIEEIRAFYNHLQGTDHDVPGLQEAFEAQRLVEAIYATAGLR